LLTLPGELQAIAPAIGLTHNSLNYSWTRAMNVVKDEVDTFAGLEISIDERSSPLGAEIPAESVKTSAIFRFDRKLRFDFDSRTSAAIRLRNSHFERRCGVLNRMEETYGGVMSAFQKIHREAPRANVLQQTVDNMFSS
jgi:hypothetical protein